jgi:Fe-S-cluster containining protein
MTDGQTETLRTAVDRAAARPEVERAVRRVYDAVQAEIDARRPVCAVSGRCCRFEEYGHRLYVTTLELAAFLREHSGQANSAWDGAGCPFQHLKLCTVHAIRPFGCRIFFCDASSTEWQHRIYERFHADMKELHRGLDVPYFYLEWRDALAQLGLAAAPAESRAGGG